MHQQEICTEFCMGKPLQERQAAIMNFFPAASGASTWVELEGSGLRGVAGGGRCEFVNALMYCFGGVPHANDHSRPEMHVCPDSI